MSFRSARIADGQTAYTAFGEVLAAMLAVVYNDASHSVSSSSIRQHAN